MTNIHSFIRYLDPLLPAQSHGGLLGPVVLEGGLKGKPVVLLGALSAQLGGNNSVTWRGD